MSAAAPDIDSLIDKGPTENLSEVKANPPPEVPVPPAHISPNDDSSVLPLSQSTDPKFADKPFNPNDFNKIKGEPEEPVKIPKDEKLEKEEKEAAEKEKLLKQQEKEADKKEKNEEPPKKDDKESEKKLPFKPLKDITKKAEGATDESKQGQRDFTGFDESEVEKLKKMSNDAFEFVRPRLLTEKELKGKVKDLESKLANASKDALPDNYFEHPEAYLLDKNYNKALNNLSIVADEMAAWEDSLLKARGGEEWIEYQWDAKRNGYVQIKRPPGPESELYIEKALARGNQLKQQLESEVQSSMQTHKQRSEKLRSNVRERENVIFPQYSDPDILKKDPVMKSLADYLAEGGLENNALLPTCCKFYAHAMKLQERVEELEAGANKSKAIEEIKKSNGPTNTEVNQGAGSTEKQTPKHKDEIPFDPNAFERLRS